MSFRVLLTLLFLATHPAVATDLVWVFLNTAEVGPTSLLTQRAEERLSQRGSPDAAGNQQISLQVLSEIRSTGVRIRHASRFLNAVSVEITSPDQPAMLVNLPAVKGLHSMAVSRRVVPDWEDAQFGLNRSAEIDYGSSETQNTLLHIPELHDLGYDGSGIMIGVFDAGFYPVHPVFDQLDIVAQYDFVDNEPDPSGVGHQHGNRVLSALAGYLPGEIVGPAYGASFLLARTENDNGESPVEEDNWVAALEWADSLGVDIISSSLNYRDFDPPAVDYPESAIDGETAVITMAANVAAQRGILVVNSAGNEGNAPRSIWPPADSPHVLAVGAISSAGSVLNFSSRGPTYDGRIKPDVVAQGAQVYVASGTQNYQFVSGTSFSTPVIAGLAAPVLEACPCHTPDAMIALFQERGDRSSAPDNAYGFGVPDLRDQFQQQRSSLLATAFPNPHYGSSLTVILPKASSQPVTEAELFDLRGRFIGRASVGQVSDLQIQVDLSGLVPLSSQIYFMTVSSTADQYSLKFIHLH